ncbi:MAG: PQQ-dependent sugar dehydrogenase [Burkholderiales bacterium]|jgi:glucose/arabinose dehydrogenase|nr:PQQ-dependent sugar dehydrogenase [Burkholderiales bacterium]
MNRTSLLLIAVLAASPAAGAQVIQTREHAVSLVTVTEGLEHPWGLAFLPDGRMLVTERPGRMRVVGRDGRLDPLPVAGLPRVDAQGQGGLLDVALHPKHRDNGWIYWSYTQRDAAGGNGTEVARGRLAGGPAAWQMKDVEVIFRMAPKSSAGFHFGSRLVFDRDGLLYVTLGDRGEMARAQRPDDHAGKILRLTDDGRPAPGNPFIGDPKARPEIFSLGNRNVQGAALSPSTGVLWAHEHGPQGGDELNVIRAGVNYGWPVITHGVNYVTGTRIGEGAEKPGMAQPVKYWVPSPALSGMAFYQGDRFPKWRGDVLIGALRGQALIRVRLDGERFVEDEFMLVGNLPRVRDVRVGPDSLVYLLTDLPNGAILRLEPAG